MNRICFHRHKSAVGRINGISERQVLGKSCFHYTLVILNVSTPVRMTPCCCGLQLWTLWKGVVILIGKLRFCHFVMFPVKGKTHGTLHHGNVTLVQNLTLVQIFFESNFIWVNFLLGQISIGSISFGSNFIWVKFPLGQNSFGSIFLWVKFPLGQISSGSIILWVKIPLGQFSLWKDFFWGNFPFRRISFGAIVSLERIGTMIF